MRQHSASMIPIVSGCSCLGPIPQVPRQAQPQVVAFPGFALTLLPTPWASCWAETDLLAGVGLKGGRPSHLEVVQVVNESTVPLFWLSPLHCVLYPLSVGLSCQGIACSCNANQGCILYITFPNSFKLTGRYLLPRFCSTLQ